MQTVETVKRNHDLTLFTRLQPCENKSETLKCSSVNDTMRFSRAQILGALVLFAIIWIVIIIRLFLSRL